MNLGLSQGLEKTLKAINNEIKSYEHKIDQHKK